MKARRWNWNGLPSFQDTIDGALVMTKVTRSGTAHLMALDHTFEFDAM